MKKKLYTLILTLIVLFIGSICEAKDLKFIQVTDFHYTNSSTGDARLSRLVKSINSTKDLDFVIFTGDNIDSANPETLVKLLKAFRRIRVPYYIQIGNHDCFKAGGLDKKDYAKFVSKYSNQTNGINEEKIQEAANEIKNGNLVLFPTETVYGIGANALDANAVEKIFIAKGRAQDNPLIVHVSNIKMVEEIVEEITELKNNNTIIINNYKPEQLIAVLEKSVLNKTGKVVEKLNQSVNIENIEELASICTTSLHSMISANGKENEKKIIKNTIEFFMKNVYGHISELSNNMSQDNNIIIP